jgi:hypothetical protein
MANVANFCNSEKSVKSFKIWWTRGDSNLANRVLLAFFFIISALWVAESCMHAEHSFTKAGQRVGDGRQLQLIGLGGGPRCTEAAMLGV